MKEHNEFEIDASIDDKLLISVAPSEFLKSIKKQYQLFPFYVYLFDSMVKRNLVANYVGQAWSAIMNLAFIPIYIKYLGIESYGLIGLFGMLQAWLSLLDMGMTPSVSREMARFKGGEHTEKSIWTLFRSIEIVALFVAITISLGVWVSSDWLAINWLKAEKLHPKIVANAFSIMGIVTALRFLEGIYKSAIVGLQKQLQLNVVNIIFSTLRGVGAVILLKWFTTGIYSFFLWQGLLSLIAVIVLLIITYTSLPQNIRNIRFSFQSLVSIRKYAGGLIGITILTLILTQIDKLYLSKLITLSEFGYFSLATTIASSLFPLIGPILITWFPKLTELHAANQNELLITKFHQGAQLVTVFMGSAAIILIFFSEPILRIWTQNPLIANSSSNLLKLSAFTCLLSGLNYIPYNTQLALGWTDLSLKTNIVSIIFIIPLVYLLTKKYGAVGAISASIILNAGQILIGTQFMFNKILSTERLKWYKDDLFIPLLSGSIIAFICSLFVPSASNTIAQVCWIFFAGILVFFGSVLSAFHVRHSAVYFLDYFKQKVNSTIK